MSFLPSHRPFNSRFSEREARLCHEEAPVESSPDRSGRDPRRWLEGIAYGMTWAGAEISAAYAETVARIPKGIIQAIYDVAKEKLDVAQNLIRQAVNFTLNAPAAVVEWVTNIFVEQRDLTPEAMANLMDLRLWILAFEGLNLNDPINAAQIDAQNDERDAAKAEIENKNITPETFLKSLTTVERRQRFATLTMSVIPKDAQTKFNTIFGDTDPTKRRNAIKDNQGTLVSAMKQMYGLDDGKKPNLKGTEIAKYSLHQLLFVNKTGTDKAHGASAGLKEEFLAHLDRRPGTMTPEGIMAQFAAGAPEASLLLGAAKLNVLTQKDIDEHILPKTEAKTTELLEESQKQRQLLEKTTRASQEELRRSGETITERFKQMPGIAQLAIVIALIGGVYKFPKTSAGIAAFFLGRYVFLKDNDPINSTGQNIFAIADMFRGVKAVGPIGPSEAVERVGEQMLKFLPNEAHEDLSEAVTGFALLAGVDVGVIADNFEPTKDGRLGWLKAWEPPVKDALRASLKARNMDTAAANRFFPSHDTREKGKDGKPLSTIDCSKHRNLCKTGDALASYFYLLGAYRVMTGTHTRKSLDMSTLGLIEQARTSTTSSGYYDDIRDGLEMVHPQQGKPVDIRTEYYEVILEGLEEGKARRGQSMEKVWKEIAGREVESMPGVVAVSHTPLVIGDGPSAGATGKPAETVTGKPADVATGSPAVPPTGGSAAVPTGGPSATATGGPSAAPTGGPASSPSGSPAAGPTGGPASSPAGSPAGSPTGGPSAAPTGGAAAGPTGGPSSAPTGGPSAGPAGGPSGSPTGGASGGPTGGPASGPAGSPSTGPTGGPTASPTGGPSSVPTNSPGNNSSGSPQSNPTSGPGSGPTNAPQNAPTSGPQGSAGSTSNTSTGNPQ